jgi:hypothetical protein
VEGHEWPFATTPKIVPEGPKNAPAFSAFTPSLELREVLQSKTQKQGVFFFEHAKKSDSPKAG